MEMASTPLPETPGRGRSRFSKALPTAPGEFSPISIKSNLRQTPLPPLPKNAMPPTLSISRKPIGTGKVAVPRPPSIASLSSVYSDSPGSLRSISDRSRTSRDSLSGGDSETPPLPPKDEQRQQTVKPAESPVHVLASPAAGFTSSPPRPEIWKRRSVRSDKSIRFPELKLLKSNGSTTSPQQRKEPSSERSLPAIPFGLPQSITGRKPVPARPAPPQPIEQGGARPDLMGSKLSKLKEKQHARKRSNEANREEQNAKDKATQNGSLQNSPFTRLPTPDYLNTDKQQPATPEVFSPRTPHTPPDEAPVPQLPQKSESRPTINGPPSSRPNLLTDHSRTTSETLTVNSEPSTVRAPTPQKSFSTVKILTPQPSPSPVSIATSPVSLQSPTKIYFPTQQSPAPKGTILAGPKLSIVQFECYQSHRYMRNTRNHMCPTACMVCEKKDADIRWRCSWCCLSACGSCMKVLASVPGKDLKVCLERLGRKIEA